jgi:hypothetical protein
MTPQEVINIIEDVTWEHNGRHYGKISPAREFAISALKKQIPKKPISIKRFTGTTTANCSVCNGKVLKVNYCQRCGQALDWSDTE